MLTTALVYGCRDYDMEEFAKTEAPIQAYKFIPLHKPIETENHFWYLNGDYTLYSIDEAGNQNNIAQVAAYYPEPDIDGAGYHEFEMDYTAQNQALQLTAFLENPIIEAYYGIRWLEMSTSGQVFNEELIMMPAIDSSLLVRSIDIKRTNQYLYGLLSATDRGPGGFKNLLVVQYDIDNQALNDTLIPIVQKGELIHAMANNNGFSALYIENTAPLLFNTRFVFYDHQFNEIAGYSYDLIAWSIYHTEQLDDQTYLIAGSTLNPNFEDEAGKNFVANVDFKGNILWYKDQFEDTQTGDFIYFYDFLPSSNTELITCGTYVTSIGYTDFADLTYLGSSSFFIGKLTPDLNTLNFGNFSTYGASAGVSVMKTSYGYALLTYMSYTYTEPTEHYLWFYKFDEDLKLLN